VHSAVSKPVSKSVGRCRFGTGLPIIAKHVWKQDRSDAEHGSSTNSCDIVGLCSQEDGLCRPVSGRGHCGPERKQQPGAATRPQHRLDGLPAAHLLPGIFPPPVPVAPPPPQPPARLWSRLSARPPSPAATPRPQAAPQQDSYAAVRRNTSTGPHGSGLLNCGGKVKLVSSGCCGRA
jgi:hypothetical protein